MPTWITGSGPPEPDVIAYSENESFEYDTWNANVTLQCAWEDRFQTVENILANALEWPYLSAGNLMIAKNASVKPPQGLRTQGDSYTTKKHEYEFAHVTVNFVRESGDTGNLGGGEGDIVYYETLEPNGEMLKLPPNNNATRRPSDTPWNFRWGDSVLDDDLTNEEAPSRLIMGLDYVVKWIGLDTLPGAALTIVNHVNDATVSSSSLGLSFDAETLLANAPVMTRSIKNGMFDVNLWDMEIRLSWRQTGWNKFWRLKTQTFESIWLHYGGDTPVEYKNFPLTSMTGVLP